MAYHDKDMRSRMTKEKKDKGHVVVVAEAVESTPPNWHANCSDWRAGEIGTA